MLVRMLAAVRAAAGQAGQPGQPGQRHVAAEADDVSPAEPVPPQAREAPAGEREPPGEPEPAHEPEPAGEPDPDEAATTVLPALPQRVRGDGGLEAGEPGHAAGRGPAPAPEAEAVTEQFPVIRAPAATTAEVPAPQPEAAGPAAQQAPEQPRRPPRRPAGPTRRPPGGRPPAGPAPRARRTPGGLRSRIVAAAAAVLAIVVLGSVIHAVLTRSHVSAALSGSTGPRESVVRGRAAAWLAAQVSRGTRMTCDPVMCAALKAHGVPAADLDELLPGGRPAPLAASGSAAPMAVLVATPAVRGQLGRALSSVYAPAVIASFGSGPGRVEIRAMAAPGAAAYRALARADLVQRRESGAGLLQSDRIVVSSAAARDELARGQVDARLLVMLADLASRQPLEVMGFGDRGPGAGLDDSPLRSAQLRAAGPRAAGAAFARSALAFLRTQAWPFAPASAGPARLPGGQLGVRFAFAAPSPLGLLG
ncbi:MAG TPA: hypothetical protein VGM79_28015 [Streptosporangiaceae bacterium]